MDKLSFEKEAVQAVLDSAGSGDRPAGYTQAGVLRKLQALLGLVAPLAPRPIPAPHGSILQAFDLLSADIDALRAVLVENEFLNAVARSPGLVAAPAWTKVPEAIRTRLVEPLLDAAIALNAEAGKLPSMRQLRYRAEWIENLDTRSAPEGAEWADAIDRLAADLFVPVEESPELLWNPEPSFVDNLVGRLLE